MSKLVNAGLRVSKISRKSSVGHNLELKMPPARLKAAGITRESDPIRRADAAPPVFHSDDRHKIFREYRI
jgi:hypothetical protein